MLEQVRVTRYVTPLKEGGSLPGIVEAEDLGTYVAKFRGAGQGLKVLVAEVIVGEIARLLRIPTPRLVELDLAAAIAKYEADQEVQDLLNASIGSNLGVDFLPGSFGYDGSRPPSPQEAADIIWLDAFTANVDRTWANPNLLVWHGTTWTIDHGAALYFHHAWPRREPNAANFAAQPFDASRHVLADLAEPVEAAPVAEEARGQPGALRADGAERAVVGKDRVARAQAIPEEHGQQHGQAERDQQELPCGRRRNAGPARGEATAFTR